MVKQAKKQCSFKGGSEWRSAASALGVRGSFRRQCLERMGAHTLCSVHAAGGLLTRSEKTRGTCSPGDHYAAAETVDCTVILIKSDRSSAPEPGNTWKPICLTYSSVASVAAYMSCGPSHSAES